MPISPEATSLWSYKVVLDEARYALKHAKVELAKAEKAFDRASEDYEKIVCIILAKSQSEGTK